jgi:hypothetical protein
MSADDLAALGEDIKKNGLQTPIAIQLGPDGEAMLLDGINRLDAMALVGIPCIKGGELKVAAHLVPPEVDPTVYVIAANIKRRHLKPDERRDLIAKLIKADPKKSDRQHAKAAGVSPQTVTAERKRLESTAQIEQLKKRVGADGRERPAHRPAINLAAVGDSGPRMNGGGIIHVLTNDSPPTKPTPVDFASIKTANEAKAAEGLKMLPHTWGWVAAHIHSGNESALKSALSKHKKKLDEVCVLLRVSP